MPTELQEIIAKTRFQVSRVRYWLDYFFPREILGPFLIVFSFENVVDILFSQYYAGSELVGWVVVGVALTLLTSFWGMVDEDRDEVQEKVDKREEQIEEETGVDV